MQPFLRRVVTLIPGIAFLVLACAAIQVAAVSGVVSSVILPPPTEVGSVLSKIIFSGAFVTPMVQTLGLLFAGYVIGCGVAVVIGILMGYFRPIYNLFEPLIELLRPIPKPALLPALMLFLGLGWTMKISIVALAAFFPVVINTVQGARSVDPTLTDTARMFGYRTVAVLWKVVLPATMPFILAGMKISLGVGLVVVIMAEMLAENGGVGAILIDMQRGFQVRDTYAWLAILAALGLGLNALFTWGARRATFWNAPATQ